MANKITRIKTIIIRRDAYNPIPGLVRLMATAFAVGVCVLPLAKRIPSIKPNKSPAAMNVQVFLGGNAILTQNGLNYLKLTKYL